MKTTALKYLSILGLAVFVIACSTKRNSFLSRNSHALSSKYNILYNGGVALDKGVEDLKLSYKDNFWEPLPIERMQVNKDVVLPGAAAPNPNFERAETKSTKAIQKHSMNIGGSEKNPQMDEAYLMLGKARYYDQRFVPAQEAFNYILYKYPNSDKIYEAKIWREKTNIRMDNDALAVTNLSKLLEEIKFKDQTFADANAILAQAFLNLSQKDSAIAKIKLAKQFTKENEEKARYNYILGQLYEELGYKDSAYAAYQTIINMKRKAAKQYVIHAHIRQASQFDVEKGDSIAFLKKYKDLLKDRENRPYLDVLNHQLAVYYDRKKNYNVATKYYNTSLKVKSADQYLVASNYRNLADINFNKAKYITAGKYYDSTMVQLNIKSREYKAIKRKRENLVDVIKYEGIATRNDSIIKVYNMSAADKISYYEDYISRLKKAEEAKKLQDEKAAKDMANSSGGGDMQGDDSKSEKIKSGAENSERKVQGEPVQSKQLSIQPPSASSNDIASGGSNFYFYNPQTVAYGKLEFRKNWGNRALKDNWRVSSQRSNVEDNKEEVAEGGKESDKTKEDLAEVKYNPDFYIRQLPKSQTAIDSIAKERNFAYYQLGVIYKEKFKEYQLAADKLEQLLANEPEERLVLPSMYNLYKIYQIIDNDKAIVMKDRIINMYPNSRYAQILGSAEGSAVALTDTPEASYAKLYRQYVAGDYRKVLTESGVAIDQYNGDEIVPKLELLKANTIGKIKGIEEYKTALNFVSLNYPNSEEGKKAEELLTVDVPKMEALKFYAAVPLSWKILYKADNPNDKNTKAIQDKIKKFLADRTLEKLSMSYDLYTMDKNFIVIHGMKTEEYARGIASILKEWKEYKIPDMAYIISNDNYKIVQIRKNFEEYLRTPATAPLPPTETIEEGPRKPANYKDRNNIDPNSGEQNMAPPGGEDIKSTDEAPTETPTEVPEPQLLPPAGQGEKK